LVAWESPYGVSLNARWYKRLGMPAGTLAPARDDALRYLNWGFSFVAVGSDIGLLRQNAVTLLSDFQGQPETGA